MAMVIIKRSFRNRERAGCAIMKGILRQRQGGLEIYWLACFRKCNRRQISM